VCVDHRDGIPEDKSMASAVNVRIDGDGYGERRRLFYGRSDAVAERIMSQISDTISWLPSSVKHA